MPDSLSPICLYCTDPATSLEHIFPESLGGRSPLLILCNPHNGEVARKCDEPLITSLAFFVHVFRIKRKGGTRGISVPGNSPDGTDYKIDDTFKPVLGKGVEILERSAEGLPTKFRANNLDAANKIIKAMNLPADAIISTETQTIASPTINLSLQFGGADEFRGILKIAYELSRGLLNASLTNASEDANIRSALLDGADPMPFVKWLPYRMVPPGAEAAFFSSRVVVWQSGDEVLAIVEFFNCLPFIVRLPGLKIEEPALYIQSVQGGEPLLVRVSAGVPWAFADVPDHAQPEIMAEFPKYLRPIMETYMFTQLAHPIANATGERFVSDPTASDAAITKAVLEAVNGMFGRELALNEAEAAIAIIKAALAFLRATSTT